MKNVFISGATGLLGGRLVKYLLSKHCYNLFLGMRNPSQKSHFPDCRCQYFNLSDKLSFKDNLRNIDIVIHLAGLNFQECEKFPEDAFSCNAQGTQLLAKMSEESGVKHFITVTSYHVYGRSLSGLVTEESQTHPLSSYARSHLFKEELLQSLHTGSMQITILRLSNAVGSPIFQSVNCWHLLVNNICKQLIETNEVIIKSNNNSVRDFIPINDVIRAFCFIMNQSIERQTICVYNLGSGRTMSLRDMVEKVVDAYSLKTYLQADVHYLVEHQNVNYFKFSIDKFCSLGFNPDNNYKQEIDYLLDNSLKWFL